MMTARQARLKMVCRYCERHILLPDDAPDGWEFTDGEYTVPQRVVVTDSGNEFAHLSCFESRNLAGVATPARPAIDPAHPGGGT